MSSRAMRKALDWVRLSIRESEMIALSDANLLEAFLESRDETAFAAIIRRHGPMVFGVCKRFLRRSHDAEDAFQAVFLVFMKRADSIRPKAQLANWLYGVAFKTACKTRSYLGKRSLREQNLASLPERASAENQEWGDFWLLLDQELNQLPAKYRGPIVLCDLEGKSRREAAQTLGLLDGTLSGRLARARRRLAARLSRRGVSLSGAVLAAAMLDEGASASLPVGLVAATTQTAFTLAAKGILVSSPGLLGIVSITKGVTRSMVIAKLWQTSAVLILSTLAVGAGAGVMTVRGGNLGGEFLSGAPDDDTSTATKSSGQTDAGLNEKEKAERRLERLNLARYSAILEVKNAEWQIRWKEYQVGKGTLDFLLQASSEILDAELALAKERTERLAAHQAHLGRLLPVLDINQKRYDAGKVATQDLAQATGAYESALFRLRNEQEQGKAIKAFADVVRKSKLIDELIDVAREELQAQMNEYTSGRGVQSNLLASSKRLRDAELKKATSSEARETSYRAHFSRMGEIEQIAKARFDAGKITAQDMYEPRYARIEAELDLEAAMKR